MRDLSRTHVDSAGEPAMTRQCMDCKATLGEKCPSCGTENLVKHYRPRDPDNPDPDDRVKVFTCMNALCPKNIAMDSICGFQFDEGAGPNNTTNCITTGICPKCLKLRNCAVPFRNEAQA
jgi:rRNA maturation protein Nop10